MSARSASAWVVVKFGGTSVSTLANWRNIALVVKRRLEKGARVLVVHSALTRITDMLEKLLAAAGAGTPDEALAAIEERHRQLTTELGVGVSPQLQGYFAELRQMANGIALVRELSDRTRARVMANGELMATEIGARFLKSQGIDVTWMDARDMLLAEDRGASAKASVLSATCSFAPDAALEQRLTASTPVVITQGFIARDSEGNTCLLGRGGSDTSAAYLAAKIRASAIEIWTDVPGMFSANPRSTPTARLIRALHYDEAQEIATSGAKVLHPRCLLPARQYQIPLYIYATQTPDLEGTLITGESTRGAGQVKAVCNRKGITLISLDSPGMWHQVGFMADAFAVFKEHGMSVDLVSTSETNVTVSLDPAANTLDGELLGKLQLDLSKLCGVQVIGPCASVSLVGRNIRAILHKLGDAFALFEEQKIYLLSQAANDLNFTFVVDENQGDRLVEQLHDLLIRPLPGDPVMGPTWEQLFAKPEAVAARAQPWWAVKRDALLGTLGQRDCAYVYDLSQVEAAAKAVCGIKSVGRALFALKANPHPDILRTIAAAGVGFDCVSLAEIERVMESVPGIAKDRILFTPNFAPRAEYERALALGVHVTIDNLFVLQNWLDAFKGKSVFLRIDTGIGRGHHHHVKTAGAQSKFGIPAEELEEVARIAKSGGVTINGLHAHAGSGVFDVTNWSQVGSTLAALVKRFPDVKFIDVGGGLGVPDRVEGRQLDLAKLDEALANVKAGIPGVTLWLEPGRYLVANAGVLLARVTQTKVKSGIRYVGVATGMNSLIRPALYGAHHDIVNLSRYGEAANISANVVGPICESSDFLGHDRLLPECHSGDVLLIATAGAYSHAMSSNYNLRTPAEELLLP
ncbi:MAG TPA: bifunctional aspartate kinase/diaminopimelate decarboxylase [Steroidobacteraceae bacterium]|nr:bifunctional aspartate kinase/diaminopimelate decarboxylase [Steroidobacteraceae bacterium]